MQDGIVIKGLAPKQLDPLRYHINPRTDLSKLEQGIAWRTIKDEFGKFKWIDHEGRVYQSTPCAVEPDAAAKTVFIASMMHAQMQCPVLNEKPNVTCPSDVQDNERRKEVAHHEEVHSCDTADICYVYRTGERKWLLSGRTLYSNNESRCSIVAIDA